MIPRGDGDKGRVLTLARGALVADLKNELVWSHSRGKAFEGCLRAYWYQYYGSWGGWNADSPPDVRDAYVQKKLTSRAMWIGTVVHGVAEAGIRRAVDGRGPDMESAIRGTVRRAREDITGSHTGRWLERPARRVGFREHYYGEEVADADWDASLAEIERQIRALYAHRIFRRILDVPERVREVEELRRFPVGDGEAYVSLDVLMDDGRGGVVIIDWKTGEAHAEDVIAAQLGVYGLYATRVLGVPEGAIRALHVNVRHGTETQHPVGPGEIAEAETTMRSSLAAMRGRLVDIDENIASKDDYPEVPASDPRCGWCTFRRVCGKEKTR